MGPVFHWPNQKILNAYAIVCLQLTVAFVFLYGTTNWIATQRGFTYQLWMNWELGIPLVPPMILPYLSFNLLAIVPLFLLNDRQIRSVGTSMVAATFLACLVFLVMPAQIGFTRTTENLGLFTPLFEMLFYLDKPANTCPSLHVTYSTLVVRGVWYYARGTSSALLTVWLVFIVAAVLFTHQHHIADILGGLILAEFCFQRFQVRSLSESYLWRAIQDLGLYRRQN